MTRWLSIGLVVLLAVGAVAFDRINPIDLAEAQVEASVEVNPSLSVEPRLNGSWFCATGSSNADGPADHEIVIVNLSDSPATANISVLTAEGPVPTLRLSLAPFGSETKRLDELSDSEAAGAVVEIIGGEGVVGHTVETAEGTAQGACSSQVSDTWYFANGRTTGDAKLYLTVINPFQDSAVFDVELRVAGRPLALQRDDLQGQALMPNSAVRLDIGEFVTPEENLTMEVTTRRGQVVAERLQTLDGSSGPTGAALQLGVPKAANSWIFPAGRVHPAGSDQMVVWNPSEEQSTTVEVGFWPVDPEDRSTYSFTAIERELPPGRFEVINLRDEVAGFGVILPYELGATVSSSDVPVVAERWHLGKEYNPIEPEPEPDEDADGEDEDADGEDEDEEGEEGEEEQPPPVDDRQYTQPTASDGLATSRGIEVVAQRWVVPWADVVGAQLVVTSAEAASLTIEIQAEGQLLAEPILESVPARGRAVIDVSINPEVAEISPNGTVTVTSIKLDSGEGDVGGEPVDIAVEFQIVDENGVLDFVPAIPTI